MNALRTTKPMKVYKPYTLPRVPAQPQEISENKSDEQNSETGCNSVSSTPPPQPTMMMPPQKPGTVIFPAGPPPQTLFMYQIVPGPSKCKDNIQPSDLPPGPPLNSVPPPAAATPPVSKTKPRTVHEYYDQLTFQWREFNPEDTVVGDETDPFIVYLRYASKSIGARRTPWILPKQVKLIKIMQDCLPDFDWRTGEDLLIKARVIYLRRKSIEEAVQKLKRGESIGPVTKASVEGKDGVTEDDEPSLTESEVKEEGDKDGTEETIKEVEVTPKDSGETTESSSPETIKPIAVVPKVETSDTLLIKVETEDTSDVHSVSDVPSTPPSTDFTTTPEPEPQPSDLVDENVRDHLALRQETSTKDTLARAVVSSAKVVNDTVSLTISPSKADADETSSVETTKPTNPKDKTEEKEDEEKTEIVRVTTTPLGNKTMEGWEMLEMVLNWVKNEFAPDEKALARQLANDEISFRFLWLYYVPGSLVSVEDPVSKQQMAARIENTDYMPPTTQLPSRLEINTKVIGANGDDFIYTNMVANIPDYDAAKRVSELPVQLLTPDKPLYTTLKERGRKFVSLNGVHYMTLDGILILNRGRDILRVRSKTRVMIDCKAFREANPSYNHSFSGLTLVDLLAHPGSHNSHYSRYGIPPLGNPMPLGSLPGAIAAQAQPKDIKTVPEDELVLCSPTVFGYAFTEKAWVQMTVEGISPIVWDTEAYNKLVLPDDTKRLVKSLVQACRTDTKLIKDIISTKGSGVVFVLHGEPGTGKTLTAEAIGEELKRPILVIAVSDLGTDPTNVEIRLGNFLRTAEKWDSIVLLDEADIFLEQRGRMDIFRNAMVGVFLRLLEYHNSPMFLTTNRVFAFDPAIRSRISIAIKYNPLKRIARKQVWQQLLEMANGKISPADMDELAMAPVNGREIKNTIRSAQALAVADGSELTMKHIKTVLDVQREFREDFEGLPGLWNGMGVS